MKLGKEITLQQLAAIISLSGKIGDIVAKKYKTGIVISKRPTKSKIPLFEKQTKFHQLFGKASLIAKEEIQDPRKKAAYLKQAKPGQSAYNIAVKQIIKKLQKAK